MTRKEDRVTEIIDKLQTLSLKTNTLAKELAHLQEEVRQEKKDKDKNNQEEEPKNTYTIGDRVTITNTYRGKKGTTGVIMNVTRTRVTLRDDFGKSHTRASLNVSKTRS